MKLTKKSSETFSNEKVIFNGKFLFERSDMFQMFTKKIHLRFIFITENVTDPDNFVNYTHDVQTQIICRSRQFCDALNEYVTRQENKQNMAP